MRELKLPDLAGSSISHYYRWAGPGLRDNHNPAASPLNRKRGAGRHISGV